MNINILCAQIHNPDLPAPFTRLSAVCKNHIFAVVEFQTVGRNADLHITLGVDEKYPQNAQEQAIQALTLCLFQKFCKAKVCVSVPESLVLVCQAANFTRVKKEKGGDQLVLLEAISQ